MNSQLRLSLVHGLCLLLMGCASRPQNSAQSYDGARPLIMNNRAMAPESVPREVHRAIQAGNAIQHMPYQFGGGHGQPSRGLDCSGTVSYVLRSCGLLTGSTTSKAFKSYGEKGAGRYITIYARDGHAFMTICGLRLDTTSNGSGGVGPRWSEKPRNTKSFVLRHPKGF